MCVLIVASDIKRGGVLAISNILKYVMVLVYPREEVGKSSITHCWMGYMSEKSNLPYQLL